MNIVQGHKSAPIDELYELSDDIKRKEWLDDWLNFMHRIGKPVTRIPIMAKQVLDLYELYRLVVQHGGLVEIINKKLWREITKGLNLPNSITSAAFTLRTQYQKYLYDYECEHQNLSCLNDLQAAIEGNRREGRRTNPSDGTENSPTQSFSCSKNGQISRTHMLNSRSSANDSEGLNLNNGTSAMMAAAAVASSFPYPFMGTAPHSMASFFGKNAFTGKDELTNFGNVMANQQTSLVQRQFEFFQKAAMDAMVASSAGSQNNLVLNGNFANNSGEGSGRNSVSSLNNSDIAIGYSKNSVKKARLDRSAVENLSSNVNAIETTPKSSLTTNMKLTNSKTEKGDCSMEVSMEVNGVMYQGVLFPTPKSKTKNTISNVSVNTTKSNQNFSKLIQQINNAASTLEVSTNINKNFANNNNNNNKSNDGSECSSKEENFFNNDETKVSLHTEKVLEDCETRVNNTDSPPSALITAISPLSEITNECD